MQNKWNPNPKNFEGTYGNEASFKGFFYGILGYLPDEPCKILILPGPKQGELALVLEEAGYEAVKLTDPDHEIPGFLAAKLEDVPKESFGVIISPGWHEAEGEAEKFARQAYRILVDGGMYFGLVASRYAASLDNAGSSVSKSFSIANGIEGGEWLDAKDLFTPNDIAILLEAVMFEVVDLFGWQLAIQNLPQEKLLSEKWDSDEMDKLMELEFRLAQERTIMGAAPTIQFVAKKPLGTQ